MCKSRATRRALIRDGDHWPPLPLNAGSDVYTGTLAAARPDSWRNQLCLSLFLLVAKRPSNMPLYLRDGSAQTIFTCYHTEIEDADQTFYLTRSQYTDTGPTSPSADPITRGAWQGSHWTGQFLSHRYDSTRKGPVTSRIRTPDLSLPRWTP